MTPTALLKRDSRGSLTWAAAWTTTAVRRAVAEGDLEQEDPAGQDGPGQGEQDASRAPLPGLVRAGDGRHLVPAERLADEIGARVPEEDDGEQEIESERAGLEPDPVEEVQGEADVDGPEDGDGEGGRKAAELLHGVGR